MRRLAALAILVLLVASCQSNDWKQTAPFAPKERPAFGARVTDGNLRVWTGTPCIDITAFSLYFGAADTELELRAPNNAPFTLERLTLGGPYPGLDVTRPLPPGFDWRTVDTIRISVFGDPGGWGSITKVADVIDGSADHPDDTYWFQDVGWLNPAQVAEQDGKTFLTTCATNPTPR